MFLFEDSAQITEYPQCEMLEIPQPLELGMTNIPSTAQTAKSMDGVLCILIFHEKLETLSAGVTSQDPRAPRSLCL